MIFKISTHPYTKMLAKQEKQKLFVNNLSLLLCALQHFVTYIHIVIFIINRNLFKPIYHMSFFKKKKC